MVDQGHLDMLKQSVSTWNKCKRKHPEIQPDLRGADLHEVPLMGADLRRANLQWANLHKANLSTAILSNADLGGANLSHANLSHTDLSGTTFRQTDLTGTNFKQAYMRGTAFINVNLSIVKGLDTVRHLGPSSIGLDTIYCSKGTIPEAFLRGAGVPETLLAYIRSLGEAPFDYFTCFISYSNEDQDFVKHLHNDLQRKGVRCWFAPEDLKAGDRFQVHIDEEIRHCNKLLVVLSKHSIVSGWVEHEVEIALQKERKGKPADILPIRLDNAVENCSTGWAKHIQTKRHIVGFENWEQPNTYQRALSRLLRALKT